MGPKRAPRQHFPNLPADIHERLAARGIDPERAYVAWLRAILDGSFPVDAFAERPAGHSVFRDNREGRSPGAKYVPVPIPLALVLPAEITDKLGPRGNRRAA